DEVVLGEPCFVEAHPFRFHDEVELRAVELVPGNGIRVPERPQQSELQCHRRPRRRPARRFPSSWLISLSITRAACSWPSVIPYERSRPITRPTQPRNNITASGGQASVSMSYLSKISDSPSN